MDHKEIDPREGVECMEAVSRSAEHHFLMGLQKIKAAPQGWAVMIFSLSARYTHADILKNASAMNKFIASHRAQVESDFEFLKEAAAGMHKGTLYLFEDNDILVITPYASEANKEQANALYERMSARLENTFCDFGMLEQEIYTYQKLCDQKLLTARRMAAYREMADRHKTSSIGLRRQKRDYPLVQVIEDDRFTASYTSGILHREYDMVLSRNGEDAILQYIETAPDIVFIDIHLPGLNGHQVLQALKIIDPKIYAVMLSVDTVKENIVKSAEGGANNFLKKPFSRERLLSIVKASPYIQGIMRRNAMSENMH